MADESERRLEGRKREAFEKHKDYLIGKHIVDPVIDQHSGRVSRYCSWITKAIEDYYGIRRRRRYQQKTGYVLPFVGFFDESDEMDDLTADHFIKTKDKLWETGTLTKLIEIVRDINLDENNRLYEMRDLECSQVRHCFLLHEPMREFGMKTWLYGSLGFGLVGLVGNIVSPNFPLDTRAALITSFNPASAIATAVLFGTGKYSYDKNAFPGSESFFELYKKSREADKFIEGVKNDRRR